MIRKSLLRQILFLIFCILVFHTAALVFYWYWSLWWFDLPLHFFGGVWLSLSSLWFIFFSGYIKVKPQKPASLLVTALVFTFTIGMLWELFEFLLGTNFSREGYVLDTSVDLLMDILGACFGYLFFIFMKYEEGLLK